MFEFCNQLFFNLISNFDSHSLYSILLFETVGICLLMFGFPSWLFAVSCSCIWGFVYGVIIQQTAVLLSEICVYLSAHFLSYCKNNFICGNSKISGHLNNIFSSKKSFFLLIILKLNPLVPFIPITFYLGYKRYNFFSLIIASLIGSIPLGLLWCFLGKNIKDISVLTNMQNSNLLGDYQLYYSCLCLLLTALAIYFVVKIVKKL